jgi:vacuolar-type H+-ATPase subunit E/Vma4
MVEATLRLQQAPATSQAQRLAQRQRRAIRVLALRRAVEATKQRLRGMGLKPQYMPMREIVVIAEEYLAAHRAVLVAEAKVAVDEWTAEGFFGKRAARSVQHLQDLHSERSAEPQALPLWEYRDRNGATQ